MEKGMTFAEIMKMWLVLNTKEQRVLVNNQDKLKQFAADLVVAEERKSFFLQVSDSKFKVDNKLSEQKVETLQNWRRLADKLNYRGPIVWQVRQGYHWREHANKDGLRIRNYINPEEWTLTNDETTFTTEVFWLPRLLKETINKPALEQLAVMARVRDEYNLPKHHMTSFGSASLLAGLILSRFKRSGDCLPFSLCAARTDTMTLGEKRLHLGHFQASKLACRLLDSTDQDETVIGCFPIGIDRK